MDPFEQAWSCKKMHQPGCHICIAEVSDWFCFFFFFSPNSTSVVHLITQCEEADLALWCKRINMGRGFWHMPMWLRREMNEYLRHFLCIFSYFQEAKTDFKIRVWSFYRHLYINCLSQVWLAGSTSYFKYFQKVSPCVRAMECHTNGSKMTSVQHRLFQRGRVSVCCLLRVSCLNLNNHQNVNHSPDW